MIRTINNVNLSWVLRFEVQKFFFYSWTRDEERILHESINSGVLFQCRALDKDLDIRINDNFPNFLYIHKKNHVWLWISTKSTFQLIGKVNKYMSKFWISCWNRCLWQPCDLLVFLSQFVGIYKPIIKAIQQIHWDFFQFIFKCAMPTNKHCFVLIWCVVEAHACVCVCGLCGFFTAYFRMMGSLWRCSIE